jgi:hypothetical protein
MATRTNLCANPSFETDLTGWTIPEARPATRSSEVGGFVGSYALRQPTPAAFSSGIVAEYVVSGLTPGAQYACSAYFRVDTGTATASQIYAAGSTDGSSWTGLGNSSGVALTTSWSRNSFVATLGASDTYLKMTGYWVPGSSSTVVIFMDAVQIEQASSVGTYFDGDTTDTGAVVYAWTGTAHASTSTAVDMVNGAATGGYAFAGTASGESPLPTPGGLTATAVSDTQIDLSWSASSGALWYEVERDGVVVARWLTSTSYSDTGLSAGTSYTYRVRAVKNHV